MSSLADVRQQQHGFPWLQLLQLKDMESGKGDTGKVVVEREAIAEFTIKTIRILFGKTFTEWVAARASKAKDLNLGRINDTLPQVAGHAHTLRVQISACRAAHPLPVDPAFPRSVALAASLLPQTRRGIDLDKNITYVVNRGQLSRTCPSM